MNKQLLSGCKQPIRHAQLYVWRTEDCFASRKLRVKLQAPRGQLLSWPPAAAGDDHLKPKPTFLLPCSLFSRRDNQHSWDRQWEAGPRPCAILVTHASCGFFNKERFQSKQPFAMAELLRKAQETQQETSGYSQRTYRCFLVSLTTTAGRAERT